MLPQVVPQKVADNFAEQMKKPALVFVTKYNEDKVLPAPGVTEQEFSITTDENGDLDMSTLKKVDEIAPDKVERRTASMAEIINAPGTPSEEVVP